MGRNPPKRVKSFEFDSITPSPSEEIGLLDPETGALIFPEKEKVMPAPEEPPYAPEQWYAFVLVSLKKKNVLNRFIVC